jgi:hypothetical protein
MLRVADWCGLVRPETMNNREVSIFSAMKSSVNMDIR